MSFPRGHRNEASAFELIESFRAVVADSTGSPAMRRVSDQLSHIQLLAESDCVEAEVLLAGPCAEHGVAALAAWLGVDAESLRAVVETGEERVLAPDLTQPLQVTRMRQGARSPGRRAGECPAPVLIMVYGSREAPADDMVEEMVCSLRERPLSILVAPRDSDWARGLAAVGNRQEWACHGLSFDELRPDGLTRAMQSPPWRDARELLRTWSVAGALESLQRALGTVFEKERRGLKAKRTLLAERSVAARSRRQTSASEVLGEVRSTLQKSVGDFQETVAERLESLVAPFDGTLSEEIEKRISALDELEQERGTKKIRTRVPDSFQRGLLERIRCEVGELMRADLGRLGALHETLAQSLAQRVAEAQGPPVVVSFQPLGEDGPVRLLDRFVKIQRPYHGELQKRGPMEYFMAARRYQMVFFMMFTTFGLSFMRSIQSFAIPAGLLLLAIGLLNVADSTIKERREEQEKELQRARETLRGDLRRMLSELQKAWQSMLGAHFSRQQSEQVEQLERSLTAYFEERQRGFAERQEKQQHQLKALDGRERTVADAARRAEQAARELSALGGQVKAQFASAVAAGEAEAAPLATGTFVIPRSPAEEMSRLRRSAERELERRGHSAGEPLRELEKLRRRHGFESAAGGAEKGSTPVPVARSAAAPDSEKRPGSSGVDRSAHSAAERARREAERLLQAKPSSGNGGSAQDVMKKLRARFARPG